MVICALVGLIIVDIIGAYVLVNMDKKKVDNK